MSTQPDITINGLALPIAAAGEIEQSYEYFGGFSTLRLGLGAAVHQETWRKIRTTVQAAGWLPAGLGQVDWASPVTLGCVATRAIQSASNVIALPAARRSDAAPYGFAVMADGSIRATPVAMGGDNATLTVVAGAAGYVAHYYPLLTVYSAGPRERYDAAGAVAGWEIVAEEA